jgi:hypothetical protein
MSTTTPLAAMAMMPPTLKEKLRGHFSGRWEREGIDTYGVVETILVPRSPVEVLGAKQLPEQPGKCVEIVSDASAGDDGGKPANDRLKET